MTDHIDFHYFRRFFYYFTKASVINIDDYSLNIQFYNRNEVLIQKDLGHLDFFLQKLQFFLFFDFSKQKAFPKIL